MGLAPGGPAEKAGIQAGDVIVGFAGSTVETDEQLRQAIGSKKPGDRVSVQVVRTNGSTATLTVTLGVRPL